MAEIQDSDRGKAERLLFALSEFVYLHEKIEDDLFVAYTECITSKAETIDLEILNDSSDKWVQDAREETDRYRSDDYHIKYPCLKIQLLHHWYLFAGFALEDARNLLLSYSPTTPQIAEKEIQNIFQLINVIFKDFKELIALLKSSYILSNKEKKLAISIIEKRNNRLKNRALIYKIICNLGLQELAGQEQHASQDNGDDDGAADVLLRDGQLITNDIKESNPISCRLFDLYEFIYMLCEFSRMRIDDKGRPQSPMIIDKSGEETPGVPWMLNEVQQGFEITDNYLTQHCPSLRDVITEAKNIFYLMCDKKKRVDEMLSIKGCDPDNVRLNLFKDMARLAVELEKAASPILVKANEYKGKPFTETITQVDKEIKSVKKSDSTPLNCNIQDNIFDRGPEIATPVINEKDSFENSPKCAYISDLYRACDELRIKISRPYHDNKWKTAQEAMSSFTKYVKWIGESSLKMSAIINHGIKKYDCQIAKNSKLIVSAIDVFSNATLGNIERFKQTYSDDKQTFENRGTTAIEAIEYIRKRFTSDINLFSKDLLLAEAQLATIDGNNLASTQKELETGRIKIIPSTAAASNHNSVPGISQDLIEGITPDLFDWDKLFSENQIKDIEQKLGPMAKNIDELAEFIETADDFIKFDNSHWTDEGPCGPSSDTEKWIFSSFFSAKKLRLGLEKMMNAEEAKHFYLQLQIALNLKIDQRGVRVQLSGEYIPKENHSPLVKQIADHLKIKILASNKQLVPLSPNAQAIYDKLCSLRPTEAMTLPKIQDWWYEETGKNLDEGTFKKYRKELLPYGLKNKPRIGYYTQK